MSCRDCSNLINTNIKWMVVCADCYKTNLNYSRQCMKCKKFSIPPEENDFISMCKICTRASEDLSIDKNMRICTKCDKPTIYPRAPPNIKICYSCINKNKMITVKRR
jgi:hypothetical protein